MKTYKTLLILFAVGFLLTTVSIAQDAEPQKSNYEKKIYTNDKGIHYLQKSLPLYLKFSTSPGGKNYDLKSISTAKYTNPMYLDTEGINWIRSKWAVKNCLSSN